MKPVGGCGDCEFNIRKGNWTICTYQGRSGCKYESSTNLESFGVMA